MVGAIFFFDSAFRHIVAIAFTSLVLIELLNLASTISTWHPIMVGSLLCSLAIYVTSMLLIPQEFDQAVSFVIVLNFCSLFGRIVFGVGS